MADKFISANAIYDELSDIFIEYLATTSDKNTKAALESLYSTVLKAVDAADAIEELLALACPHHHRNVHDRGDDSYCDVLNREVPKEVE